MVNILKPLGHTYINAAVTCDANIYQGLICNCASGYKDALITGDKSSAAIKGRIGYFGTDCDTLQL